MRRSGSLEKMAGGADRREENNCVLVEGDLMEKRDACYDTGNTFRPTAWAKEGLHFGFFFSRWPRFTRASDPPVPLLS